MKYAASRIRVALWGSLLLGGAWVAAGHPENERVVPAPVSGMAEVDRINLELNLRWVIARERAKGSPRARIGVYADAGVWHLGARSIVAALEEADVQCRVLDRSLLTTEVLAALDALVLPGGWAPFQIAAAGDAGLLAIEKFVRGGGRCLGICAGAYLLSREVEYECEHFSYPLGLFDGTAKGPLPGLAHFPSAGEATLAFTESARLRGVAPGREQATFYSGGPCFVGGTDIDVLARYADGSAAAIARRIEKGEIVLLGAHFERPPPTEGDETAPPPQGVGSLFKALLLPRTSSR